MPDTVAAAIAAPLTDPSDGDAGDHPDACVALAGWTITVSSESCCNEDADPFLARSREWSGPVEPTLRDALTERIRDPSTARDLAAKILAVVDASPLPRVLVRKQWRYENGSLHTLTVALNDDHRGVGEAWYVDL